MDEGTQPVRLWAGDELQKAAAWSAPETQLVVVAGPGTGKTDVAAQRLIHLLKSGLRPAQVLVLSFSNSAVRTLTRRLEQQSRTASSALEDLRYLSIRTFDSWTFRMLRRLGDSPQELMARNYDENISELIERMKGDDSEAVASQLASVSHVLVDEFQDLAGVRAALVAALLDLICAHRERMGFTLLGDDAQAIYGFAVRQSTDKTYAHATPAWLVEQLRQRHPALKEVVLEHNYRAGAELACLAKALRNVLRSDGSGEQKLERISKVVSELPELDGELDAAAVASLASDSVAVLTRTNGEALQVAQQLAGTENRAAVRVVLGSGARNRTIPGWVGALLGRLKGSTVTRAQFSRVHAHVCQGAEGARRARALCLPDEATAWVRLLRAAGVADDASAFELKAFRERMDWLDAFPDDEGIPDGAVRILTIHQSKGMEFQSVGLFVPDDEEGTDEEMREAASVLFVAVTRAGKKLLRVPSKAVYPLYQWRGNFDHARWYSLKKPWLNVEVGQPRDINPASFVDTGIHGGEDGVVQLQEFLAGHADELAGRRVMLKKRAADATGPKQIYGIHLQEDRSPGLLLGTTTERVTLDLLGMLHKVGLGLPTTLMNLRIAQVVTMQGSADKVSGIANEYASSGLWLGLQLQGVAFGKVFGRG